MYSKQTKQNNKKKENKTKNNQTTGKPFCFGCRIWCLCKWELSPGDLTQSCLNTVGGKMTCCKEEKVALIAAEQLPTLHIKAVAVSFWLCQVCL